MKKIKKIENKEITIEMLHEWQMALLSYKEWELKEKKIMRNDLTKNNNQITIEQWFSNKSNVIDIKEIQRFKSNVLSIKNQLGLANANINTILEACYQATLLQLPLEKNFGYCWVVPFKGKAQFQMGYKGYIQLAQRSQQYKRINANEIRMKRQGIEGMRKGSIIENRRNEEREHNRKKEGKMSEKRKRSRGEEAYKE